MVKLECPEGVVVEIWFCWIGKVCNCAPMFNFVFMPLGCTTFAFSALMLLVGEQEGHLPVKKQSGGVLMCLCVWSKVQTCIWPS